MSKDDYIFNDLEEIKTIDEFPKKGFITYKGEKFIECFKDSLPYSINDEPVFCVIYESIRKNGTCIKIEYLMNRVKKGFKGISEIVNVTMPKY